MTREPGPGDFFAERTLDGPVPAGGSGPVVSGAMRSEAEQRADDGRPTRKG